MRVPPGLARGRVVVRLARTPLLLAAVLAWGVPALAGQDWLPPRPVTLVAPSATYALGAPRTYEFLIRAHGAPASLRWTAIPSGIFVPILSSTTGTVSLAANQTVAVPLTVTVPGTAPTPSIGFITFKVTYEPGGGQAAQQVVVTIRAATGGRPELYPVPGTATAPAGAPGSVTYELKSTIGSAESFNISVSGRTNPDPSNSANLFPYFNPPSPVNLPGAGTVQFSVPVYLPGEVFPGNTTAFLVNATSVTDITKGPSDARGHSVASTADPDSVPSAFFPVGFVPQEPAAVAAGRDGPVPVPGRDLFLVASGNFGVRVVRDSSLDQAGPVDLDNNSLDDRLDGRLRPPTFSASMAVVPGFVNSAMEVLDIGLLAAGRGGLMLVDLRELVDFPGITWESWFDLDGNGIDDRILRRLPIPGFATDVEWFRTPEGRVVALVAAADTGSVPTAVGYNPALTVPGTGAGIYAVDVLAALDSLPGVPFVAGVLPTAGDVLDLELRGGPLPELAVADGANGVSLYSLAASGVPATVGFTALGTAILDATWGTPHARDLAWIPSGNDSLYLAVASAGAGIQIVRAPHGLPPMLALAQRTEAAAIGVASTRFGYLGAALGTTGATLLRAPLPTELDQIQTLASPPYQAPVVLDIGESWTEGRPLRSGGHGAFSSSITSLRFRELSGDPTAPDLLCSDGSRTMTLRSGLGGVLAVGNPPPSPRARGVRLAVSPNPIHHHAEFRVSGSGAVAGASTAMAPAAFTILDLQGRVVRRLVSSPFTEGGPLARAVWDGRDQSGQLAAPGRYWVRAALHGAWSASAAVLVVR